MYFRFNCVIICLKGAIDSSEIPWEVQRKLVVQALQNFHFAKASRETMIWEEVETMLDLLREKKASPISGERLFNAPLLSSLWQTVTGERLPLEEETRSEFVQTFDELYKYECIF